MKNNKNAILSDLETGCKCVIIKIKGHGGLRKHLIEQACIKGSMVDVILNKPLHPHIKIQIKEKEITLRRSEAAFMEVIEWKKAKEIVGQQHEVISDNDIRQVALELSKDIQVATMGNDDLYAPLQTYKSYRFSPVSIPESYALPFLRNINEHENENQPIPDVIVHNIDANNLEKELFLTTHIIDMNIRIVIALRNVQLLKEKGDILDAKSLSKLLGVPIVFLNEQNENQTDELAETIIKLYEGSDILDDDGNLIGDLLDDDLLDKHHHAIALSHKHGVAKKRHGKQLHYQATNLDDDYKIHSIVRHIHINYGASIEKGIEKLKTEINKNDNARDEFASRYLAIKLLEKNNTIETFMVQFENSRKIIEVRNHVSCAIQSDLLVSTEQALSDAKKGFIHGALKETLTSKQKKTNETINDKIDAVVTHKFWGYIIFFIAIFITFEATFALGAYPMRWIESLVDWTRRSLETAMQNGMLKDLLIDGIVGGVGGVLVFLPNILILYFFLTLLETSGYMARAAFIMDKVMHLIGLHGRSFIPLIMGFGCNVPAIMATRSICNRNSRMITILINPLMSCSARLPIYILFASAFFPAHAGLVLLAIYFSGILLAALVSLLFKRFLFSKDETPYVMELPPYRIPGVKSILRDTWDKGFQYVKKIGTVILLGSVIIWALSYFPRHSENVKGNKLTASMKIEQQENSYLGRIGKSIAPVLKPLGFDWKISIALLTGVASKEIVVSTLGVLYNVDAANNANTLTQRLQVEKKSDGSTAFTPAIALSLMLFVLIYFPCIATIVTIKQETGRWKWALFAIFYTLALAWIVSFTVYQSSQHHITQEIVVGFILLITLLTAIHKIKKAAHRKSNCESCKGCDYTFNERKVENCPLKDIPFKHRK